MHRPLHRVFGVTLICLVAALILNQSSDLSGLSLIDSAFGAENPPIIVAHVSPTTGRFALHSESDRRGR